MRGLVVFLLVLVGAAVAADLMAERLVTDRAEQRLAAEGVADPQVRVAGFPFLPQLLTRSFGEVQLRASGLDVRGAQARRLRATGEDVAVPRSGPVTVARLRASGLVGYDEVLEQAGLDGVSLEPADGGSVRLRGEVTVLGQTLSVGTVARVEAAGRSIRVVPQSFQLGDGGEVEAPVADALQERFAISYRLRDLPESIELTGVTARPQGFLVEVRGSEVALDASVL